MICPSCGSRGIFYDRERGELVCTSCGLVIYDRMPSEGSGLRDWEGREPVDHARHDLGIGSEIGGSADVSPAVRSRMRRMRRLHRISKALSWKERSTRSAMVEIENLCRDLRLPRSVRVEACVIYRRAKEAGLTKGRDTKIVAAVVVLLACRQVGVPKSEKEVLRAAVGRYLLEEKLAQKIFRRFLFAFKKEMGIRSEAGVAEYLQRFMVQLGVSGRTSETVMDLLRRSGPRIRSRSPVSLSAALIYLGAKMAGEELSVRRVSKVTKVSVSSISSGARLVRRLLELE